MSYILIAEDERDMLLLMVRKLEMAGYTDIWSTSDGREALAKALESPPRLILLDIMLPGIDGLTICAEIKKKLGDDAPPIILISARGQQNHVQEGESVGADAYIVKPFYPRELLQTIESFLK